MKRLKYQAILNKNIYMTIVLSMALIFSIFIGGCSGSKISNDLQQPGRNQDGAYSDTGSEAKTEQIAATPEKAAGLERKVAQTANLQMQVQDAASAADQIISLCSQNSGYTVNSHIFREDDRVSAQLAIKVPTANLLPVITSISALGEVTDKVMTTQDVTEQYYDSEARLKVLKAKEERLIGLMDKAANITEIINVENELSKTRSEIEVLSGSLQYLSNITDYSLINITLKQGVPGTVQAPRGTLGKAWQALVDSINGVINFVSGTVVFLFAFIPWLIILAVLGLLGRLLYKRIRNRPPTN